MSHEDKHFAARFSAQRDEAEAHLRRRMEERGLYERDGWRIVETTREARHGTELVMRPLHLKRPAPSDLECVVWVRTSDGIIDIRISPEEES